MLKNMVEPTRQATDDNTIRRMRLASWITNATDTYGICTLSAFVKQVNGI